MTGAEDRRRAVFVLDPGSKVLADSPIYRDMETTADRFRAFASALAASPGFRGMSGSVLVVRTAEPARLVLLGSFSDAEAARVEFLPGIIEQGLRRLRYVSYEEAERAARSLCRQLTDALGAEVLSRCCFAAIPRGGVFVLGMLAYLLDLRAQQMAGLADVGEARPQSGSSDAPLVLVDDCALSGLRFAEALATVESTNVVFAHLFSHPKLRESILERQPGVAACFAGEDLVDMADVLLGPEREQWETRWRERSSPFTGWIGLPEHVCFPWNEPDITIWNPATSGEEAPWRLVPPEFCLKNRPLEPGSTRLQEQPVFEGPIRPGRTTMFARLEQEVLVANTATGRAFSFEGVAGEIWMALLQMGDPEAVAASLAAEYDAEPARIREDVDAVLERCTGLGLLERVDGTEAGN